jgi:hypothetical protein
VPIRPLVFLSGLTLGDYLLWNWSLNANHAVLALISGLTLPPLAVACLWLLALALGRLIARGTTVPRRRRAPATTHPERSAAAVGRAARPEEEGPAVIAPGGDRGRIAA